MTTNDDSPNLERFAQLNNWQEKYRLLMQWGKHDSLQESEKIPENLVPQCAVNTWLIVLVDATGCQFRFYSESKLVTGLGRLFLTAFDNKAAKDIIAIDIEQLWLHTHLNKHLSPSRSNGVINALKLAQQQVQTHC